jgi:hypothetical protein
MNEVICLGFFGPPRFSEIIRKNTKPWRALSSLRSVIVGLVINSQDQTIARRSGL